MYKLEHFQHYDIRILYKPDYILIVHISALMRSLGWLKFTFFYNHML